MIKEKFMFNCEVCGKLYQSGGNRGGIFCCDFCWDGNWDGWAPHYENILLEHLKRKGLPIPKRNAKGWLPRN